MATRKDSNAVGFAVGAAGTFDLAPRQHSYTDTASPEKSRIRTGGHGPAQLARSATCPTGTLPGHTRSHTVTGNYLCVVVALRADRFAIYVGAPWAFIDSPSSS